MKVGFANNNENSYLHKPHSFLQRVHINRHKQDFPEAAKNKNLS